VADPARVMRMPCSRHVKDGGTGREVRVTDAQPKRRYALDDVVGTLPELTPPALPETPANGDGPFLLASVTQRPPASPELSVSRNRRRGIRGRFHGLNTSAFESPTPDKEIDRIARDYGKKAGHTRPRQADDRCRCRLAGAVSTPKCRRSLSTFCRPMSAPCLSRLCPYTDAGRSGGLRRSRRARDLRVRRSDLGMLVGRRGTRALSHNRLALRRTKVLRTQARAPAAEPDRRGAATRRRAEDPPSSEHGDADLRDG